MRTTLSLDQDVYEAAKALAESTGRTLGQVVSDLVRTAIKASQQPARETRGGLPVFRVSDQARIIPSDRAAKLQADEGVD